MRLRRQPATLGEAVRYGLLRAVRLILCFAFGVALATLSGVQVMTYHDHSPGVRILPHADPTARIITEHGCWTGPAPKQYEGKFPGGVVLTQRGGAATYSSDPVLVGAALDFVLKQQQSHDIVAVHAFCPPRPFGSQHGAKFKQNAHEG